MATANRIVISVGEGDKRKFYALDRALVSRLSKTIKDMLSSKSGPGLPFIAFPTEKPTFFRIFLNHLHRLEGWHWTDSSQSKDSEMLGLSEWIEFYLLAGRLQAPFLEQFCIDHIKSLGPKCWWSQEQCRRLWKLCEQSKLRLLFAYSYMELYLELHKYNKDKLNDLYKRRLFFKVMRADPEEAQYELMSFWEDACVC